MSIQIADIVKSLGGARQLAERLRIKPGTIYVWVHRGWVPRAYHLSLYEMLRAQDLDVTPAEIARLGEGG